MKYIWHNGHIVTLTSVIEKKKLPFIFIMNLLIIYIFKSKPFLMFLMWTSKKSQHGVRYSCLQKISILPQPLIYYLISSLMYFTLLPSSPANRKNSCRQGRCDECFCREQSHYRLHSHMFLLMTTVLDQINGWACRIWII